MAGIACSTYLPRAPTTALGAPTCSPGPPTTGLACLRLGLPVYGFSRRLYDCACLAYGVGGVFRQKGGVFGSVGGPFRHFGGCHPGVFCPSRPRQAAGGGSGPPKKDSRRPIRLAGEGKTGRGDIRRGTAEVCREIGPVRRECSTARGAGGSSQKETPADAGVWGDRLLGRRLISSGQRSSAKSASL